MSRTWPLCTWCRLRQVPKSCSVLLCSAGTKDLSPQLPRLGPLGVMMGEVPGEGHVTGAHRCADIAYKGCVLWARGFTSSRATSAYVACNPWVHTMEKGGFAPCTAPCPIPACPPRLLLLLTMEFQVSSTFPYSGEEHWAWAPFCSPVFSALGAGSSVGFPSAGGALWKSGMGGHWWQHSSRWITARHILPQLGMGPGPPLCAGDGAHRGDSPAAAPPARARL